MLRHRNLHFDYNSQVEPESIENRNLRAINDHNNYIGYGQQKKLSLDQRIFQSIGKLLDARDKYNNIPKFSGPQTGSYQVNQGQHQNTFDSKQRAFDITDDFPFPGFARAMDVMSRMRGSKKVPELPMPINYPISTDLSNLQQELEINQQELLNIRANYWLVHKKKVEGISGYYCKKCKSLEFGFIKDVGYDKTAAMGHSCNPHGTKPTLEEQFIQFISSIRSLNLRHLLAFDISSYYKEIKAKHDTQVSNILLGIPNRYCFYKFSGSKIPSWLLKALSNLENETLINFSEVWDFIITTKSTYAIFEIELLGSKKIINAKLIP